MALPLAPQDTTVRIEGELVSLPYIDMTLAVLDLLESRLSTTITARFEYVATKSLSPLAMFWLKVMPVVRAIFLLQQLFQAKSR